MDFISKRLLQSLDDGISILLRCSLSSQIASDSFAFSNCLHFDLVGVRWLNVFASLPSKQHFQSCLRTASNSCAWKEYLIIWSSSSRDASTSASSEKIIEVLSDLLNPCLLQRLSQTNENPISCTHPQCLARNHEPPQRLKHPAGTASQRGKVAQTRDYPTLPIFPEGVKPSPPINPAHISDKISPYRLGITITRSE